MSRITIRIRRIITGTLLVAVTPLLIGCATLPLQHAPAFTHTPITAQTTARATGSGKQAKPACRRLKSGGHPPLSCVGAYTSPVIQRFEKQLAETGELLLQWRTCPVIRAVAALPDRRP